jgi:IMP dehydrogenase
MADLGGLGVVHRCLSHERHAEILSELDNPVACIGVGEAGLSRLRKLKTFKAVLIDVAHGHCDAVINQIHAIKEEFAGIPIMAGNVATYAGAYELAEAGADCIKVGVGCGSLCTTRLRTGCGVPQLTAILQARQAIDHLKSNTTLVADGGIRDSGDIMKALAAGADAVMVGNLFSGTQETPGRLRAGKNYLYKVYRGMASREAQEDWKGVARSVEGESIQVPFKGSVHAIFEDIVSGMCSSMSYLNARNLNTFRNNAEFIRQTPAGYRESLPHGML